MNIIKWIIIPILLLLTTVMYSAEPNKTIMAEYKVVDNIICLELSGKASSLIEFNEFTRTLSNPDWRDDPFQMKYHLKSMERIKKSNTLLVRMTPEEDEDVDLVNNSTKNLQRGVDNWDGDFIIKNPMIRPKLTK